MIDGQTQLMLSVGLKSLFEIEGPNMPDVHIRMFKGLFFLLDTLTEAAEDRVRYGHSEECASRHTDTEYCDCGHDKLYAAIRTVQRRQETFLN